MPLRHEGKKNGSSPLKGEIGDDILAIEKHTLNDYPSPKPLIADGHDPLSLTRNDNKKERFIECLPIA